jgi:hypothetical protein
MLVTMLALSVAVLSLAWAAHQRIRCRRAERDYDAVIGRLDRHDAALSRAPVASVSASRLRSVSGRRAAGTGDRKGALWRPSLVI